MSAKVKAAVVLGAMVLFSIAAQAGWGPNPDVIGKLFF